MLLIMKNAAACLALAAAASASAQMTTAATPAPASSRPPGARDGDRNMTCADIAAERTSIGDAVAKASSDKARSAKTKKRLFGFAKTFAGLAVPGMMGGMGGTSMIGSLAAQSAGTAAGDAIGSVGQPVASDPAAAKPSADQQARLDRLDQVGAFRRCAA